MNKLTKEQIKAELIEVIASDLERCAPSYSECAYLAETIIQRFIALESLGEEEAHTYGGCYGTGKVIDITRTDDEGFHSSGGAGGSPTIRCNHEWDEGHQNVYKCIKCGKYNC